jgi:hypothetical protein
LEHELPPAPGRGEFEFLGGARRRWPCRSCGYASSEHTGGAASSTLLRNPRRVDTVHDELPPLRPCHPSGGVFFGRRNGGEVAATPGRLLRRLPHAAASAHAPGTSPSAQAAERHAGAVTRVVGPVLDDPFDVRLRQLAKRPLRSLSAVDVVQPRAQARGQPHVPFPASERRDLLMHVCLDIGCRRARPRILSEPARRHPHTSHEVKRPKPLRAVWIRSRSSPARTSPASCRGA